MNNDNNKNKSRCPEKALGMHPAVREALLIDNESKQGRSTRPAPCKEQASHRDPQVDSLKIGLGLGHSHAAAEPLAHRRLLSSKRAGP